MTDNAPVILERVKLPSAPASEAAALISMIERAAADPSVDIDRIERMYAMYERAAARNARAAYDQALSDMAPKLPIIEKRGEIRHGEKLIAKYALWEEIAEPVTKVLVAHGFSLSFRVKPIDGKVEVTAILAHRDGHREETGYPFPVDTGPGRNATQAIGSSISYGKRYTACLLLNIITKGEDDDGRAAISSAVITDEQADEITTTITAKKIPIDKFLEYMRVESVSDIPARDYERAMTALRKSKGGGK